MTKLVLIFGSIAGLICGGMFFLNMPADAEAAMKQMENGQLIGYATMIISLSSIFFAVKQYRDTYLGGNISFGKAFLVGLYITLVAGVIYVIAWEIYYTNFATDFTEFYLEHLKSQMAKDGMTEAAIATELAPQAEMMTMYNENMPFRLGLTFLEIFPVGVLISLISAGLFAFALNKKDPSA